MFSFSPPAPTLPATHPHRGTYEADGTLVVRARQGDDQALQVLFQRHGRAATAVARRELRNPFDVDDAVAEAFTRTFERLGTLRDPQRFRGFLLAVVRSVATDQHRARQRSSPASDLAAQSSPGDVEATVVISDQRERLLEAIALLPPRQRYAVRRFYWDEVTVSALSAELGTTVNATTQLLFRARAAIALRTDDSCRRPPRR